MSISAASICICVSTNNKEGIFFPYNLSSIYGHFVFMTVIPTEVT